jgi:SH3-like domain-containing protein
MRHLWKIVFASLLTAASAAAKDAHNPSGMPIPRFVSLKSEEVNVRTGPGTRYPIQWVYRREGWPVEIIEEFDQWRKIRDLEGTSGWVHKGMLAGSRTALVRGKGARVVRADPDEKAHALFKVEPMVLAKLGECGKEWCRVQVSNRKGWLKKSQIWGVYPGETLK